MFTTTLRIAVAASLATLALIGAGCVGSNQMAVPATQGNTDALVGQGKEIRITENFAQTKAAAESASAEAEQLQPSQPQPPVQMNERTFPGVLPAAEIEKKLVRISTPKGEIIFEVYAKDAPKAASNFIALAKSGYYDGLTFHRVVAGFVIQGGDPTGDGTGGPGYRFEDEPVTRNYEAGTVAMANAGPDTNGSQFFICLEDQPSLPKAYTIFGKVTAGLDVVRKIAIGDKMTKVTVEDLK